MAHLSLRLLGSFQATLDGQPITAFESDKVRALLAYLAVEADQPHRRERLAGLFWPEMTEGTARANLRYALANLRSAIGDAQASPAILLVTRQTIQFNRESDAWVDVHAFVDLLPPVAIRQQTLLELEEAVALVRGDFLEGFGLPDSVAHEEWMLLHREHLARLRLAALHRLVAAHQAQQAYDAALRYAWQQVEVEPYQEAGQQQLMHLLALTGQRSAALAQYDALRRLLRDELGVEPAAETRALYRRILSGEIEPAEEALRDRIIRGYDLVEPIGEGSFGTVYRALQPVLGREVAVKVIRPEYASRPEFVRRFEAEAQVVARLEHLHIVPLYDYWREPDGAYLVMRLFPAGSLHDALAAGPWGPPEAARALDQVASALAAAHGQGVVHGDVKPANILLDEARNAYLSDFCIAREAGLPLEPGAERLSVSPEYAAPEQWRGGPVTPLADLYSLGVVLYELLAGQHPFPGATPAELHDRHLRAPLPPLSAARPGLPPALDAVVARATAKAPRDRFSDAQALVAAFREAVAPAGVPAPGAEIARPEPRNPYVGLRPFEEADAVHFFGRDAQVEQLVDRLQDGGEPLVRFLAVVGPSGSGKSSLVRAGLVPALRRGAVHGSEDWFVAALLPGAAPLAELETALLGVAVGGAEGVREALRVGAGGLLRAAEAVLPPGEGALLLVIDQFEELWAPEVDAAEREQVLRLLHAAVSGPGGRVRVLITLRADFYDRPLRHPRFSQLLQSRTHVLVPLTAEELAEAVRGPAERAGVVLEGGLAEAIVAGVADEPGALPMFQYALSELFERRSERTLTWDAYRALGGVSGALARRAEAVYQGLDGAAQAAAQQVFVRLVTPGEGAEDTRRRVPLEELRAMETLRVSETRGVLDGMLDAFGRARLLLFDRDPATRAPTVEVAHEALLRAWARLRDWLEAGRADLRTERLLAGATREWAEAGRDPGFLLRGTRLAQFEGWAAETSLALTRDERAYLEASLAARQARQAEEEARRQRELAAAQALAEEQTRRAEEQAQGARRLRRRAMLLASALLVALLLAVAAGVLGRRARRNADLATSRELAATAVEAARLDPELGVLLALEAVEAAETVEAQNALHATLPGLHLLHTWSYRALCYGTDLTGDLRRAALENEDGSVTLWQLPDSPQWDVADMQPLAALAVPSPVTFCRLGRDGARLFITRDVEDGSTVAEVWDVPAQRLLFATPPEANPEVCWGEASPDMRFVVTVPCEEEAATTLTLWDVASGRVALSLPTGHAPLQSTSHPAKSGIMRAGFSADGSRLATAGVDGSARVFDTATGEAQFILTGHDVQVNAVAFSPDGQRLATAGEDNTARIWDLAPGPAAGQELVRIEHESSVDGVAFSPDGRELATGTTAGEIALWNAGDGGRLLSLRGSPGQVHYLVFGPDGARLFSESEDAVWPTRLWDLSPDRELLTLPVPIVSTPAFGPDGTTLAAGAGDGRVLLWDSLSGELLLTLAGHSEWAWLAFSPDGGRLATTSWDGTARVWDARSGAELLALPDYGGQLFCPAFSPDGRRLAAGTGDGEGKVWDAASGQELFSLEGHAGQVSGVVFSPDGRRLATGGWDDTARLWDAATGQVLAILSHGSDVFPPAFSPDGSRLAVPERDRRVTIWDVASDPPVEVRTLEGHTAGVDDVAWSPDGTRLASGGFDGTVRLWDIASGQELLNLAQHTNAVTTVSFSPDGMRLASGGWDGTVRVYTLRLEELVALARQRVTRSLTDDECRRYLHLEACPPAP